MRFHLFRCYIFSPNDRSSKDRIFRSIFDFSANLLFQKYMHPSPQTGADASTMSKGGGAAEAASARATALPWCLPGLPVGVGESERSD